MPESATENDPVDDMMDGYDGSEDQVLWEARDMTMGEWKEGQVVYTFDRKHSVCVNFSVQNTVQYSTLYVTLKFFAHTLHALLCILLYSLVLFYQLCHKSLPWFILPPLLQ